MAVVWKLLALRLANAGLADRSVCGRLNDAMILLASLPLGIVMNESPTVMM